MKKDKIILQCAMGILVGLILKVNAQTSVQDFSKNPRVYTKRYSFWFEGNFNGTIKKNDSGEVKLQYQIDFQHRRMSDASYIKNGEYYNIFKDPFQQVIRPWLHYWVNKKVRLSLSPLGHWATWSPTSEGPHIYNPEYRTSLQLTTFETIGKFNIQQRYRFEFRWIGTGISAQNYLSDVFSSADVPSTNFKERLRYCVRVNYNFNKTTYLSLWNELLIGLGKNTANNKILDQNRVVGLFGKKYSQQKYPIKLELGFTWQLVPKYNFNVPPTQDPSYGSFQKNNWESNWALQIYLIFDEFHKFKNLRHSNAM
jgi:hypothetical protein